MKMKWLFFVSLLLTIRVVYAQSEERSAVKEQKDLDWYNCSFEADQVYGAAINKAYQFLKDKKGKSKPIVALIGGGIDWEHEALKNNIWTNPKEKPDGKDNDRNGYVDDVHGWNFLGAADGQVMEKLMVEGDREFLRLKDKYDSYFFDGKNYFKYVDGKRVVLDPPADMDEYKYYQYIVMPSSRLCSEYGSLLFANVLREYVQIIDKQMKDRNPGKTSFTVEDLVACVDKNSPRDSLRDIALYLMAWSMNQKRGDEKAWEGTYNYYFSDKVENRMKERYERVLKENGTDLRKEIVGDNYMDINDRIYGNNVLLTLNSEINTMVAGIIAGKRGVEGHNSPIAENAQIMNLVVSAESGEPYLKDMALAIRYAVDHQADIILLGEQNTVYPKEQKQWMIEAIRYAESKGVLVVVPTWDLSFDVSQLVFYPNRWMDGGKDLTNLLVVASSDKAGNPSIASNYGVQGIDLFAPGMEVFAPNVGDTYKSASGPCLAAATVAGIAALIKTYYPRLTGNQIRDVLLKTVSSRKGVEVQKNCRLNGQMSEDLFLFEQLCQSGGIVNAYQALVEAERIAK